ncbi:DUF11 domain-containing protein [Leucobacter viscericola]|uniref:DUF11 domain-containing protein n=1 Tax=Leucobacter viscericola TaxID=2714935 RepID=UPI001FCB8B75|nr:DUF11 domain-containing protein [Leucobacter viscericola]
MRRSSQLRVGKKGLAVGVAAGLLSSMFAGLPASAMSDGLTASVGSAITVRSSSADPGFTLTAADNNDSGASFSSYLLGGLPTDWVVKNGGATVQPASPDPVLYSLPKSAVLSGQVSIIPPVGYIGTLSGLSLSREALSPNLITDFDGGTFDYIGTAKPQLTAGNTNYEYHDPTVGEPGDCNPAGQYGPCDGQYSIWPTAGINGPREGHYNNLWADLRSVDNPMPLSPVTTSSLCDAPWNTGVSEADSAPSGKLLIVNGSSTMPVPNDLIKTTVTGLQPDTFYSFSGYIANVSYSQSGKVAPVRSAFFAGDNLIGSSQPSPVQASCYNGDTAWVHTTSLVNTGSATSLTIGVRNYGSESFGNDLAIDNISLFPMASVVFDATVLAEPVPGLHVVKTADPVSGTSVARGDTVTYSVVAENTGETPLRLVTVTDDLAGVLDDADLVAGSLTSSAGAAPTVSGNTLSWTGNLAVGEKVTLSYKVKVKTDSIAAATLVNHVVAAGEVPGGPKVPSNCVDGTEAECTTTHPVPALTPGLHVAKTADPVSNTVVGRGDTVTYSVVAENTGDTALSNVAVTDDLSGVFDDADLVAGSLTSSAGVAPTVSGNTLSWTGDLAVGGKVTLSYRVTVHGNAANGAALLNHVVAAGEGPGGVDVPSNCVAGTEPECTTTHPLAQTSVKIEKTDGKTIVGAGESLTYDVTVTNTGADRATGVTATDVLPAGVTFVSATDGGSYDPALRRVTWNVGTLAAGAAQTVHVTVTVDADVKPGQQIRNVAIIDTDQGCTDDPATPVNECEAVDIDETPAIRIVKTDNKETVVPGEALTYTLTVTNAGTVAADNVTVTDALPAELEFVSAGQDGTYDPATGKVSWTIPSLAAGSSTTVEVTANVAATVGAGVDIANVATVDLPQGCIDDPATETNECESIDVDHTPAISIEKDDHETIVQPGEQLTYDLVVTNKSQYAAKDVTVSDVLPQNLVFVSATNGGTYDAATRAVSWSLGDMDANSTQTIQVVTTVADSVLGNEIVSNTARVLTENVCVDDPTTDVDECESTDIDRVPAVSMTKDDGKTIVRSGETLDYVLTAKNIGDVDAPDVVVTDILPANVDFVSASVEGTRTDNRIEWNIGTLEPGEAREIVVTVKVHEKLAPDTEIANTATITTDGVCIDDPATGVDECEATDIDVTPSDVWILKDDHKTEVKAGEELTYDLTVGNNSTTKTITDAVVTDSLPKNAVFVSATDGGVVSADGKTVTWKLGELAPGATTVVKVTVKVAADAKPGDEVLNTAVVDIPGGCIQEDACESTDRDVLPKLSIVKTDHKESTQPGGKLTYDVTVTNETSVDAEKAVVTDRLPQNVTYVSSSDGGVYNTATHTVTWSLGTLAGKAVKTVKVTVTVNADATREVVNVATVKTPVACSKDGECEAEDVTVIDPPLELSPLIPLAVTGGTGVGILAGAAVLLLLGAGTALVVAHRRKANA